MGERGTPWLSVKLCLRGPQMIVTTPSTRYPFSLAFIPMLVWHIPVVDQEMKPCVHVFVSHWRVKYCAKKGKILPHLPRKIVNCTGSASRNFFGPIPELLTRLLFDSIEIEAVLCLHIEIRATGTGISTSA